MNGPLLLPLPYGTPWGISHSAGTDSEDIADLLANQCSGKGITVRRFADDEVRTQDLYKYAVLLVSLPTAITNLRRALAASVQLIRAYRGQRASGLQAILEGRAEWFDVGVVQTVGLPAVQGSRMMRDLRADVCRAHRVLDYAHPIIDVFSPFHGLATAADDPAQTLDDVDVIQESIHAIWGRLHEYGIEDPAQALAAFDKIQDLRTYYNSKKYTKLYRPHPTIEANMLVIILDYPADLAPPSGSTSWISDRARVCRETVWPALAEAVPGLRRPTPSGQGKDSTVALRRLYDDLKMVRGQLQAEGERSRPTVHDRQRFS